MKAYTNDFVYGRDRVKYMVIAAVVSCVLSLVVSFNPNLQLVFTVLTIVLFVASIYTMVKYCRCPSCGKIIFLGVLTIKVCPRCKRSLITGKKVKKSK